MEKIRGHVYCLYPTLEQEKLLLQTVGVVRLIHNLALEQRQIFGGKSYGGEYRTLLTVARTEKAREKADENGFFRKSCPTSAAGLSDELSVLRREFPWIGVVSQTAQNQALIDLDRAFTNFFEGRAGYPKPRRKGRDDSFRHVGREIEVRRLNRNWSEVKIPKIGWIRYRDSRPLATTRKEDGTEVLDIRNATLRRRPDGRWEISIAVRCHIEERPLPSGAVGIDRGVAVPYALSTGEMITLPETMARRDRILRRAQKDLSRKKRGSRRYARARRRIARLQARNAAARRHVSHVLSRRLVRDFGLIAIENLSIRGMTASAQGTIDEPGRNVAQKSGLNRSILNVGWYGLEPMLAYKLEETGGLLVKVKAAWSSCTCSCCGHVDRESRKSQAVFRCTGCGLDLNADLNAARVILQRALRMEDGEDDRRGSTPSLDVEGKASAPVEASTRYDFSRLDAN